MLIMGFLLPKFLNQPNHKGTIEVHFFFKDYCSFCEALRSPTKLVEQAKFILNGDSELLNSNLPSYVASEDKSGFIFEKRKGIIKISGFETSCVGNEPKCVKINGIIKKIEIMINNNFISFIICKIKFFF